MTAREFVGVGLLSMVLVWSVVAAIVTGKMIEERKRRLLALGRSASSRDKYAAIFDDEFVSQQAREPALVRVFLMGLSSEATRPLPEPRRSIVVAEIEWRQTVAASTAPAFYALVGVLAIPTAKWLVQAWRDFEALAPNSEGIDPILAGAYWSFVAAIFCAGLLVIALFVVQGLLARTATRLGEIAKRVKRAHRIDREAPRGHVSRVVPTQLRRLGPRRPRRGAWQRG